MNNNDNMRNIIRNDFDKHKNYNSIMSRIGENKMNNFKKYIIPSCIVVFVMIFSIVLMNNNLVQKQKNDTIIFNDGSLKQNLDIDGKAIDTEIVTRFGFLSNLDIPNEYKIERSFEQYERANREDLDYAKLWQYVIIYTADQSNSDFSKNIEIIFTKEDHILACMLPDKDKFPTSIINGKEISLFNTENTNMRQAFFEFDDYKFFIEANNLTEEEFINLIKSIIK